MSAAPRTSASRDAQQPPLVLSRRRTYDGVLRALHGVMALSIFAILALLLLSHAIEDRIDHDAVGLLHTTAGFLLAAAWAGRMVWGVIGPSEARLARLWHPRAWIQFLRARRVPTVVSFGHHPLASAAYLAFYAAVGYLSASGLVMAAAEFELGPLAGRVAPETLEHWAHLLGHLHPPASLFVTGFVIAHLVSLVRHERRDGIPWAQAMLSGYQYRPASPPPDED
jgi:Ni/Fe-hydrogenase 1 B-type cytochrome subunit